MRGLLAVASPPAELVVVAPPGHEAEVESAVAPLLPGSGPTRRWVVTGGAERPDSVRLGLRRLSGTVDRVLVHDAARAATPPPVIEAVIAALSAGYRAVVPALPVTDTIKRVAAARTPGRLEQVTATLDRARLRAVQTPQGFDRALLERAHDQWAEVGPATDDAGMVEALGEPVHLVPGDLLGTKITTPPDLALVSALRAEASAGLPAPGGTRGSRAVRAAPPAAPVLLVLGGLPGTGKTTLARAWARQRGAAHVRIDTLEQALLAGPAGSDGASAGGGTGGSERPLAGPEGYQLGYAVATDQLVLGLDVVADSVNPLPVTREAWRSVAERAGARLVEVELVLADQEEHRRRVAARRPDIAGHRLPSWAEAVGREYAPWPGVTRLDSAASPERLLGTLQEVTG